MINKELIAFRIDAKDNKRIKRIAKNKQTSYSQILREIIQFYFENNKWYLKLFKNNQK